MSTSLHYKANLRDIYFNLFEDLRIQDNVLGKGDFADMDEQTAREALAALEKLCVEEMCKSFVESDRVPLTLDGDGNVTLPPGLKAGMQMFFDQGWHLFELPTRLGGYGAPPSVILSTNSRSSPVCPPTRSSGEGSGIERGDISDRNSPDEATASPLI